MQQQNVESTQNAEFRQCFKCNYEARSAPGRCPQCRSSKFLTSSNIRTRGIVLIVVGLFLAGFMGAIALFVGMLIFGQKDPDAIRKVNEEIVAFGVIYLLFGAVFVFGLHSIVSGIWMAVAGKRNRFLLWLMWALLAAVAVIGGLAGFMVSK